VGTRHPAHAEQERAAFKAFLDASPTFAAEVVTWEQPTAEFPDVAVKLREGRKIDFELAEWLHGEQMARAVRRSRLVEAIGEAVSEYCSGRDSEYVVILFPRDEFPGFEAADAVRFRTEIDSLIEDTQRRWSNQRLARVPTGRLIKDLVGYPTLKKYVARVHIRQERRPAMIPWIVTSSDVRSYSPQIAREALALILRSKLKRYGGLASSTRLLVYYGRAIAYNTPYYGVEVRSFRQVAELAAEIVSRQASFEKIYLLNAIEPGLEAFEIFPNVTTCL